MNDSRPPAWLREHPGAGPNLMYRQTWGTFLVLSPLYQTTSPLSLSSHAPVTRMKGNMCESHAAPDRVGLAVRFSLDLPPGFSPHAHQECQGRRGCQVICWRLSTTTLPFYVPFYVPSCISGAECLQTTFPTSLCQQASDQFLQ